MVDFLVIDFPLAYNRIVGRPSQMTFGIICQQLGCQISHSKGALTNDKQPSVIKEHLYGGLKKKFEENN